MASLFMDNQKAIFPAILTYHSLLNSSFKPLLKVYSFIGRQNDRVRQKRDIFHLLAHSPDSPNSQVWVRSKPGTRNYVLVSHRSGRASDTWVASQVNQQEGASKAEKPRLQPGLRGCWSSKWSQQWPSAHDLETEMLVLFPCSTTVTSNLLPSWTVSSDIS